MLNQKNYFNFFSRALEHFIYNYKILLYQASNVTQFFDKNAFEMDSMKLWSRNLVSLDNNNIEVKVRIVTKLF